MSKQIITKHSSGVHIREIEKKLFSYLFVNKVATSKQIGRDVYTNFSHQALYKRLNKLIEARYLTANYHKELGGRLAYHLSPKAFQDFIIGKDSGLRRQIKSDSILHDLDLVDIRKKLKGLSSVTQYFSENVIRSGMELPESQELLAFKHFYFDAIVSINRQNENHFLALEYERSLKFSSRYLTYFKKLYANPQIKGVLFICGNDLKEKYIQDMERKALPNLWPKTFYTKLSRVLNDQTSVTFSNLNREKIILN